MSYLSSGRTPRGWRHGRSTSPARRSLRGSLAVVAAVLVPVAVVGWLLWQVAGSSGGSGGAAGGAGAGRSAAGATASAGGRGDATTGRGERGAAPSASGTAGKGASTGGSADASHGAGASAPASGGSLIGKVIVVDPGHNPGNHLHTREINRQVDIGSDTKECDTTGTATNSGYPEATFTLDVARRLRTLLEKRGAKVILTQDGDRPWGPCVDERARMGNDAHADAAISVHADGSASGDRGFHVILPGTVHQGRADTRAMVRPSRDLGERVAGRFARVTGSAPSNYVGAGTALDVRDDLGGLNLSRVPKVFIECANMRDSQDAAKVKSGSWRQKAAQGISEGIVSFLHG